jgi:hypothetical protein
VLNGINYEINSNMRILFAYFSSIIMQLLKPVQGTKNRSCTTYNSALKAGGNLRKKQN